MIDHTRSEDGFTLIELLVASLIGVVVLLAAFALLDTTVRGQHRVQERIDAVASGRQAMELLTRQLRSQICLGKDSPSVTEATDTRTTFYASLAPQGATASTRQVVQRRTLEFVPDGSAAGTGKIVETVLDSKQPLPYPDWTGTPVTRTIVTGIAPVAGIPLFQYYKFDPVTAPNVVKLTTPVSDTDRALLVRVEVTFDALPSGITADASRVKMRLDSQVTVRTADPNDPTHSPKCI